MQLELGSKIKPPQQWRIKSPEPDPEPQPKRKKEVVKQLRS